MIEAVERWTQPEPNSGCLIWLGALDKDEYARGWIDGKTRHVHRAVYECVNGAIPPELVIDHKCRVRCCVNPGHLHAVTQRTNVTLGDSPKVAKARHARVTHCPQGHEYTKENTYYWASGDGYRGRACKKCTLARQKLRRAKWQEA